MKPQKKQETEVEKVIIPEDLLCILCSDLLTDAIMMPCCGTSFCDECKNFIFCELKLKYIFVYLSILGIRNALLESEENECPDCHGKEISPETLIPNRYLRNAVNGFKDKTGYSKRIEAVKEKIIPPKEEVPVPQINVEPPPKEGKYAQFISEKFNVSYSSNVLFYIKSFCFSSFLAYFTVMK